MTRTGEIALFMLLAAIAGWYWYGYCHRAPLYELTPLPADHVMPPP